MKAVRSEQMTRSYRFGSFFVDAEKSVLLRDGEVVPLTPRTFEILLVLIRNRGRVLEKDEQLKEVWADTFVEENNLARNISVLRKALGEGPNEHKYIVTVPGRGYRFVASVTEVNQSGERLDEQSTERLEVWSAEAKVMPENGSALAEVATKTETVSRRTVRGCRWVLPLQPALVARWDARSLSSHADDQPTTAGDGTLTGDALSRRRRRPSPRLDLEHRAKSL
jgi:DNA-binding winged helix-turn-helix (wHTH) protein